MKEPTVERCPTLEELLQAADCELSPEAHATVLQHLDQCVICQARDRHALRTLRDVHGYLAGAFGDDRQQARHHEFQVGLHKLKQAQIHESAGWPLGRWLPMAALVPVFIVSALLSRTGVVVLQADEILQRAAQEQIRPRGVTQRVRVRMLPPGALAIPPRAIATFDHVEELTDGFAPLGAMASAARTSFATAGAAPASNAGPTPESMAKRLAAHRFDLERPFDVARFSAWRGGLVHKEDQVVPVPGASLLLLRTRTTDDRDLVEVELTVARDDYHVVRAAFVFAGVGRLEIDELVQWTRRPSGSTLASAVPGGETAVDRDTLARAELATRWTLAQTGLDLPGTLRVSVGAAQVRIDGAWPSAAERRALNARLLALPHVSVNLRMSDGGIGGDDAGGVPWASALRPGTPLSAFLEQAFVDVHEREAFMPELRRLSTTVRQRLVVMQDLAQRYSESEIRALSPEARAGLQQLLDWQYQQLRADLNGLDTRVRVLSGSESRAFPASTVPADWARRTAAGLTQAMAFDRVVQDLLAQQDLPASAQDGQDPLSRTFRALWDAVVGVRQAHAVRAES